MIPKLKKGNSVSTNENKTRKDSNPDKEEMEDIALDEEIENNPKRVIDEENEAGVDDAKYLLHAKRWDVYMK